MLFSTHTTFNKFEVAVLFDGFSVKASTDRHATPKAITKARHLHLNLCAKTGVITHSTGIGVRC